METKFAKVSGDRSYIVVDLKRKRDQCGTDAAAPDIVSPLMYYETHKLGKRRKVDGGCTFLFQSSLENYHSNFMKSGMPKRLMSYQHGQWVDFPKDTLELVEKAFQAKNGMVEVEFNGEQFVLDFVHMFQLHLKTGVQQPIAWIDEADRCYFPETFSNAELPICNHDKEDNDYQLLECQGSDNIKLQLVIDMNGSYFSALKESSGEFNHMRTYDTKVDDCRDRVAAVEYHDDPLDTKPTWNNVSATLESGKRHMDAVGIREIFYEGIHLRDSAKIIAICPGMSSSTGARYELFQKQVEITQRFRGDSNVQYAWLPSSKKMASAIMKYGLGFCSPSNIKPVYGYGVYVIPAKCTEISAKFCDIDENGVRHMILCRVILGNVELVSPGSKQFHPSSEEFDSGMDNLQNPKRYIVWNMNASTHIYPEYVVSFQISSDTKGFSVETASLNFPVAGACLKVPEAHVNLDSPASGLTSECHQASTGRSQEKGANGTWGSVRVPKSPWISVPELFAAISNEVPVKVMRDAERNYELYKRDNISRDVFIRNLRFLVGDPLLRAMLTRFQHKVPSTTEIEQMDGNMDLKLRYIGNNCSFLS